MNYPAKDNLSNEGVPELEGSNIHIDENRTAVSHIQILLNQL